MLPVMCCFVGIYHVSGLGSRWTEPKLPPDDETMWHEIGSNGSLSTVSESRWGNFSKSEER